jgi:glucose/arabinose dehydrogenase
MIAGLASGERAARAQGTLPTDFADAGVVSGLDFPAGFAFLPDGRVLVVEQMSARLRLFVNGAPAANDPVATLPGFSSNGGEQGLLGIAVDPRWPSSPYLYVHGDNAGSPTIRISRYTAAGDLSFTGNGSLTVDPATRYDLLNDAPDLASNHNGGTLRFGLDNMLYASLGDDASCGAQDTVSLRGVVLRLDVSQLPPGPGSAARALITPANNPFVGSLNANKRLVWAFGLRNPFRFQVDAFDGSLWVGDVGQNKFEEIDHVVAGGHNFGWPAYEANTVGTLSCAGAVRGDDPVYFYDRTGFTAAVICAGSYRRPASASSGFPPAYVGNVFLNDYYAGFLRRLVPSGAVWVVAPQVPGQPATDNWGTGYSHVSDWAVGPDGALWYCRQADDSFNPSTGAIRRVAWTGTVSTPPAGAPVEFFHPVPSPARGFTNFSWLLPQAARVELDLFDTGGRRVRHLVGPEVQGPGTHGFTWDGLDEDGRAVRPGIYVAHLVANGRARDRRIAMLR